MVLYCDVGQRDSLLHFGSLTYIGQVQIILCGNGPADSDNRETKSKCFQRACFHNCGDYPSQIFDAPLPEIKTSMETRRPRRVRPEGGPSPCDSAPAHVIPQSCFVFQESVAVAEQQLDQIAVRCVVLRLR